MKTNWLVAGVAVLAATVARPQSPPPPSIHGKTVDVAVEELRRQVNTVFERTDIPPDNVDEVLWRLQRAQLRREALTTWQREWSDAAGLGKNDQLIRVKERKYVYYALEDEEKPFGQRRIADHEALKRNFYRYFERQFGEAFEQRTSTTWERFASSFNGGSPEQQCEVEYLKHRLELEQRAVAYIDEDIATARKHEDLLGRLYLATCLKLEWNRIELGYDAATVHGLAATLKNNTVLRINVETVPNSSRAWTRLDYRGGEVKFAVETATVTLVEIPSPAVASFAIALQPNSLILVDITVTGSLNRLRFDGTFNTNAGQRELRGKWWYETADSMPGIAWDRLSWTIEREGEFCMLP